MYGFVVEVEKIKMILRIRIMWDLIDVPQFTNLMVIAKYINSIYYNINYIVLLKFRQHTKRGVE